MEIVFLETISLGDDINLDRFDELGHVTKYRDTPVELVPERVRDADVVVINKIPMNEKTLAGASHLKLVAVTATGMDNIDRAYTDSHGILSANVAGYSTEAVAQHTFALALYLLEHLPHYDTYVKGGSYGAQDRFSNFDLPFTELAGKTWGIIGMGNIGRMVAKIATAFGCKVFFHSVTGKSTCTEYEQISKDELLAQSDILSLHCPLSDLTRNFIDKEALSKMKKTALLINVARGPVVNNADLYDALESGEIAAAGLDVLEKEPIAANNPLGKIRDSNKLIITPHMAWASVEARERLVNEVYKNIEAFLKGEDRNIII